MSLLDKIRNIPANLKQLLPDQVRFPSSTKIFFDFGRASDTEIEAKVGDGTGADVLMSPIRWLQRAMREAPLQVLDSAGEPLEGTPLAELLKRPNPEYGITTLTDGATLSLSLDGNAYWIIARNNAGQPVELWYAPHTNMEPKWPSDRSDVFISHYEYTVAGDVQQLAPEDVLHFREGVDLRNIRKGLSPLKGLFREVFTDQEAAEFTAALLRNNGVPGLVISPADSETTITPDEAEAAKAKIETETRGVNRGRPIVMTGATKVEQFGFSPRELDLSPLRDISEERVTAALGVAAAVVGFGSGLQQTKVGATMDALIRSSWSNGVIPLQRNITDELSLRLAPDFPAADAVRFNNTAVEALRENENTKAERLGALYKDGVITRAEARAPLGHEVDDADKVYRISFTDALVPQGQPAAGLVPSTQVSATGTRTAVVDANGNGKGAVTPELVAAMEAVRMAGGNLIPDYVVTPFGIIVKQEEDPVTEDPPRRIVIVGGPRRGKSTIARGFRDEEQIPTFCTDPLSLVKDPENGVTYLPEGLDWSASSKFVADHWLTQPGPWLVEGIATVRALRKFLAERPGQTELLEGLEVIVLEDGHPDADINPRQEATAKAVATIWAEISDSFPDADVRRQPVEPVEPEPLQVI